MMAQNSWPFHNGTSGTPVLEDQWSAMARQWAANGVIGSPNDDQLQVYATGNGREVAVRAGKASVRGHWYLSDAVVILPMATNASGNPRIDRVVLRLDPSANSVVLAVKQGTPAASPTPPALTATDTAVFEVSLAKVTAVNGFAVISGADIADERVYSSVPVTPMVSSRPPGSPTVGQLGYEVDTNTLRAWDGAGWNTPKTAAPVPTGSVTAYAGSGAPSGWALCDGSVVSRSGVYGALFGVIGTAFNAGGEAGTHFRLPDMRDRFVVGVSPGKAMNVKGGAETHTLSAAEMPTHSHGMDNAGDHQHGMDVGGSHAHNLDYQQDVALGSPNGKRVTGAGSINNAVTTTNGAHSHQIHSAGSHSHGIHNAGGGAAHNNMPPYIALAYIIKL